MKQYSFLQEITCDENDLEFLNSYLAKAREEVKKTDGCGELDMTIIGICDDLKKAITKDKLEDYQEATQKFRKQVVNTLICHLHHLRILGSINGCGCGPKDFLSVLSLDYIKYLVDFLDRRGLLCESLGNVDPIFSEDDWKFIENDLLMYRMRIQKCINMVEMVDELRQIEEALYDKIRDHAESLESGRAMFNVNAALAHQLTVYRNQLIKDDPNDRPTKDDILRTLSMLGLLELNKRYGNEELEVLTVTPKIDCNQKMVVIKQSNLEHDYTTSDDEVISAYEAFLDALRDFNGIYIQSRTSKEIIDSIRKNQCFWCGFQLNDQVELSKIARAFDNRYCLGDGEFVNSYDDHMWKINTTSSDYCPRGRNPLVWFDIVTVRPFLNNKEARCWLLQAAQSMRQWQDPKFDKHFRTGGHEDDDNVSDQNPAQ